MLWTIFSEETGDGELLCGPVCKGPRLTADILHPVLTALLMAQLTGCKYDIISVLGKQTALGRIWRSLVAIHTLVFLTQQWVSMETDGCWTQTALFSIIWYKWLKKQSGNLLSSVGQLRGNINARQEQKNSEEMSIFFPLRTKKSLSFNDFW